MPAVVDWVTVDMGRALVTAVMEEVERARAVAARVMVVVVTEVVVAVTAVVGKGSVAAVRVKVGASMAELVVVEARGAD